MSFEPVFAAPKRHNLGAIAAPKIGSVHEDYYQTSSVVTNSVGCPGLACLLFRPPIFLQIRRPMADSFLEKDGSGGYLHAQQFP